MKPYNAVPDGPPLDFTSSLYLGMRHPSHELRPWTALTCGVPAALGLASTARDVGVVLAELQGCERATLARSSLHAFVDVFATLVGPGDALLVDAGAYPIARWAFERVVGTGVPVATFNHHDPDDLRRHLRRPALRRTRPLVVADGLCPGCGGPAPVQGYLSALRRRDGLLVLDDTQALGILGEGPVDENPYGRGGGGTLRWAGVERAGPAVVVTSLAKGFGAPIAAISGSASLVERLEREGETRVHCSPPSTADLHAAVHALDVNRSNGDRLRSRLAELVLRLRRRLAHLGLTTAGGDTFPVQAVLIPDEQTAARLHRRLASLGVRTVLQQPRCSPGAAVTFIVTVSHDFAGIDRAADAMGQAAADVGVTGGGVARARKVRKESVP